MSKADIEFIAMCNDILKHGTSSEGHEVRARWQDGTPAHTIMKFAEVNRFDLQKEFPVLTLRKVATKSALDELLWIWQKKSNNIHQLKSHIWDEWANEYGSIGKAYGYQLGLQNYCSDVTLEGLRNAFPESEGYYYDEVGREYVQVIDDKKRVAASKLGMILFSEEGSHGQMLQHVFSVSARNGWYMDQVDKVIYDLKNNPFSRRIMTTLWNPADLAEMNLQPCAWNCEFVVEQKPGHDKLTLNMILNQRSQDILAAWHWNTYQYACLILMLAQVCDMEPGEFVHIDANCHIYDRHVETIKELIQRKPLAAPEVWINPDIHDFYKFTADDIKMIGYEVAGPQVNVEIAV